MAVAGVVAVFSAIVVGRLCDRVGNKPVLVACTGTAGLFCMPQAFAASVLQLGWMRGLMGLSDGGTGPAVNALVGKAVPKESYGRAYGLVTAVAALGGALGPVAGGAIAARAGIRLPFIITGVMLIVVAVVAMVRIQEPRRPGEIVVPGENE
jgi:DHA1 family multidrug resistance protein-like MFS transporter